MDNTTIGELNPRAQRYERDKFDPKTGTFHCDEREKNRHISRVVFDNANLSASTFCGARIRASFTNADLTGADLEGADLSSATGLRLSVCTVDATTQLPIHFPAQDVQRPLPMTAAQRTPSS